MKSILKRYAMILLVPILGIVAGCTTPVVPPVPVPSAFIQTPTPTNGALNVVQPVTLAWSYVGQGVIPMPTADVLTNGHLLGTGYMGTNATLLAMPDGATMSWQVIAHTAAGVSTGSVWRFTTAIPTPAPAPVPPVVGSVLRGGMFIPARSANDPWMYVQYITVNGTKYVCCNSCQAYARCHGESWEGDYRANLISTLQAIGANSIVFYADYLVSQGTAFACFVVDRVEDDGVTHVPNDENTGYQLAQAGVTELWLIVNDSPAPINWGGQEAYVKGLADAVKGARGLHVHLLEGTECNRNETTAQVQGDIALFRKYFGASVDIWVGSSQPAFLQSIHALDAGVGLWLEQASDPIMVPRHNLFQRTWRHLTFQKQLTVKYALPLDSNTLPAYKASLLALPGRVCAGEFWIINDTDRQAFTTWCLQNNISCGCGQYTSKIQSPRKPAVQWSKGKVVRPGVTFDTGNALENCCMLGVLLPVAMLLNGDATIYSNGQ